jgi:hypothetical protein
MEERNVIQVIKFAATKLLVHLRHVVVFHVRRLKKVYLLFQLSEKSTEIEKRYPSLPMQFRKEEKFGKRLKFTIKNVAC